MLAVVDLAKDPHAPEPSTNSAPRKRVNALIDGLQKWKVIRIGDVIG